MFDFSFNCEFSIAPKLSGLLIANIPRVLPHKPVQENLTNKSNSYLFVMKFLINAPKWVRVDYGQVKWTMDHFQWSDTILWLFCFTLKHGKGGGL